ncbi:MAG: DNA-3-methyladenine glycosylase [Desulfobacteraceae bacterium]|nr:MAG: DNA-3-methyladenine glycosylase [Desulfobacteraceae bacterium]
MQKLLQPFYDRDTVLVARDLLGKLLVHKTAGKARIGKIVEVEAYLGPHDRASHSSKGPTPRNQVMFGPPGRAYIYLIYGIYCCMNVVTEAPGHGSAVLLRAVEPVQHVTGRTQGPGLLCKAMHIDRLLNGHDLTGDTLYIAASFDARPITIVAKPRVGVAYAGDWVQKPLRFYIRDNPYVSRK